MQQAMEALQNLMDETTQHVKRIKDQLNQIQKSNQEYEKKNGVCVASSRHSVVATLTLAICIIAGVRQESDAQELVPD
jgi:hypothetical protein